ncbi:unnamed protein product [Protopolystoma xenopodis]|uniref:Uncharacterized protein n=1 Tax=Protopolystoma xenopodis TaxID=117903 RepID=A0A3S5AKQ9_9PLAT|nr:unnamed protein product [Protopolystoma xenopodis]
MDKTTRERLRYLGHIPLGCPITIVELDLVAPILSKETLDFFAHVLDSRQAGRRKRAEHEQHLTKLKEISENRIPNLPPGFVLSGPATLDGKSTSIISNDFPLPIHT